MRRFLPASLLLLLCGVILLVVIPHGEDAVDGDIDDAIPPYAAASERLKHEYMMLRDPATGTIPYAIRRREIAFAATLPSRERDLFAARRGRIGNEVWSRVGPGNFGGRTRAVAFDRTGPDTIIAGGVSGGIWRSGDGGQSWTLTTDPAMQPYGASCIVQDPRPGKEQNWYVGTGETYASSASSSGAFYVGNGIYHSSDNGRSWRHLESSASNSPAQRDANDVVSRIAIDYSNLEQTEIYAAVDGGIRRSTDGGETWSYVLGDDIPGANAPEWTDVVVSDSGVVYVAVNGNIFRRGIHRSVDGVSYKRISTTGFPVEFNRIVLALAPSNQNRLYLVGETPESGKGGGFDTARDVFFHSLWTYEYLSGDGTGQGGAWEDRSGNIPEYRPGLGDYNSQRGYNMVLAVKPDDEDVVFLGGTNLYRSTDGFRTTENTRWVGGYRNGSFDVSRATSPLFEDLAYPNHHPDLHVVDFDPTDPDRVLTGSDGGLHVTGNGMAADSIEWISLNEGYITSQFYSIGVNQSRSGADFLVGGTQDNGSWLRSDPESDGAWKVAGGSDGGYAAVLGSGERVVISKQLGLLFAVDVDLFGTIETWRRLDPVDRDPFLFLFPFAIDRTDESIYYANFRSILSLDDIDAVEEFNDSAVADLWRTVRYEALPQRPFNRLISTVAVSEGNPSHRIWYGSSRGDVFRLDDPNGEDSTVVDVTAEIFPQDAYIVCIAVDPENGDRATVVFSNYGVPSIFHTTDAGESWENVSGNLEENPDGSGAGPSCRWVKILYNHGTPTYLLGTSTGLFATHTFDGTNTNWTRLAESTIGSSVVTMIDARPHSGFVAVATHGAGVYTATFDISGVTDESRHESGLSVRPNPVRDRAVVAWDTGRVSNESVILELFDATGRMVLRQNAARGKVEIDVDDLESGAYVVRVSGEDGVVGVEEMVVRR